MQSPSLQTSFADTSQMKVPLLQPVQPGLKKKQSKALVAPILFLHIPKTAGTTMQYIIDGKYKWRSMKTLTNNRYKHSVDFEKLSLQEKKKIKVIKGHLKFSSYINDYPGEITCFTILRDPYKRSVSAFNFLRQHKNHPFNAQLVKENYSLKEILKGGYIKQLDNCHVRFLASAQELKFGLVNEETYKTALKNFDTYFQLFGISERFDESLIHFKRHLNWSFPFYIPTNISNKKKSVLEFDEETNQLLAHYNQYDQMLYEYACKKFDAVIKLYGNDFTEEVKRFQRLNKLQAPLRNAIRRLIHFFHKPPYTLF